MTTGHQQQQQQQETQQERSEAGEVAVGGRETEGRVEGLTPAMQYLFTIYAHNAMGPSKPSEVGWMYWVMERGCVCEEGGVLAHIHFSLFYSVLP